MTIEEFYSLVADMRATQKEYFRTRDANTLNRSKDLERAVDKAIRDHDEDKMGCSLF